MLKPQNTPLSLLKSFSKEAQVYAKLEYFNPSGTHKDRESWEIIHEARANGFNKVGIASTGNAAVSLAAFARMAELECHVFVSKAIPLDKLALIEAFIPVVHKVDGSYHDAVETFNEQASKLKCFNANPGRCRGKLIGDSNIGLELAKLAPDYVICPTNNGTLLLGVWMGLKQAGVRPKMIAATAANTKIADSIAGFHKCEDPALSQCLAESQGKAIEISDKQILAALKQLMNKEGIIAEPASATAVAALKHLPLKKGEKVVCIITGTGMKYPASFRLALANCL